LLDRTTHCYVGWAVLETRIEDELQAVVDAAPQARTYYSDGFATYANLVYGAARYEAVLDKSQTYTVEGGNADLRHYLARLGRKSRCFSRCIVALRRAIKLFVWAYNQRQLWQHQYPKYRRHVIDFVSP
jgi:insertion element IS1 protein InsB